MNYKTLEYHKAKHYVKTHTGIVYLPIEVYTEPVLYWFNPDKDSTIIYSDTDFIFGSPDHDITYSMEEIIEMNVEDFIITDEDIKF